MMTTTPELRLQLFKTGQDCGRGSLRAQWRNTYGTGHTVRVIRLQKRGIPLCGGSCEMLCAGSNIMAALRQEWYLDKRRSEHIPNKELLSKAQEARTHLMYSVCSLLGMEGSNWANTIFNLIYKIWIWDSVIKSPKTPNSGFYSEAF